MSDNQGPIIIDTPEGIHMWRMLSFRSALSLEIKTGMKFSRGSVLAAAQAQGLTTKRTKKGAYADIDAIIVSLGGESKPLD
jgi:hypothetical protein